MGSDAVFVLHHHFVLGNAHNQLAVIAGYRGNEFDAVYHYFRSLSSERPFLSARENLVFFLEKNRLKFLEMQKGNRRVCVQMQVVSEVGNIVRMKIGVTPPPNTAYDSV